VRSATHRPGVSCQMSRTITANEGHERRQPPALPGANESKRHREATPQSRVARRKQQQEQQSQPAETNREIIPHCRASARGVAPFMRFLPGRPAQNGPDDPATERTGSPPSAQTTGTPSRAKACRMALIGACNRPVRACRSGGSLQVGVHGACHALRSAGRCARRRPRPRQGQISTT